eukprot:g57765.t1
MIQIAPTQVGECVTQESVCADVAAHVVLRVDVDVDVDVKLCLECPPKPAPRGADYQPPPLEKPEPSALDRALAAHRLPLSLPGQPRRFAPSLVHVSGAQPLHFKCLICLQQQAYSAEDIVAGSKTHCPGWSLLRCQLGSWSDFEFEEVKNSSFYFSS